MKFRKRISLLYFICIVSLVLVGLMSCSSIRTKPDTPVSSLQAIRIEFANSFTSFVDSESISIVPVLNLINPNLSLVSTEVSYSLSVNGENLGSSQIPMLYIPANGNVTIRDTVTTGYLSLFLGRVMGGKGTPAECHSFLLPIWKGLEGKIPAMIKKEQWDETKPADLQFMIDVVMSVSNGVEKKDFFEKLNWNSQ